MEELKLRKIRKSVAKAINEGSLSITEADDDENPRPFVQSRKKGCYMCGIHVPEFDEYIYMILNDAAKEDIEELVFCNKGCWREYMAISLRCEK